MTRFLVSAAGTFIVASSLYFPVVNSDSQRAAGENFEIIMLKIFFSFTFKIVHLEPCLGFPDLKKIRLRRAHLYYM